MATIKDIRVRIKSVKDIQQITKAMKMVSAAKLKKTESRLQMFRDYEAHLNKLMRMLSENYKLSHPAFEPAKNADSSKARRRLLVIASDKGLCGPFNNQVIRESERCIKQNSPECILIGKRLGMYYRKRPFASVQKSFEAASMTYHRCKRLADVLLKEYCSGTSGEIYCVSTHFASKSRYGVKMQRLLPVDAECFKQQADSSEGRKYPYEFEPAPGAFLNDLVRQYMAMFIFKLVIESQASEYTSRMNAMEAASTNASKSIEDLTLVYNRLRQASITKEILEIAGGAEALKDQA